nr:DUF1573 domain-containing protein [uncultured Carboxylicivirga sp.]
MKKKYLYSLEILVSLGIVILLIFGFQEFSPLDTDVKDTAVDINQQEIDMGEIKLNHPGTVTFSLKNVGENNLIIWNVEASCGCTNVDWDKKPIKVNHTGQIKVTYDAKYQGVFRKRISVYGNFNQGLITLNIKGCVI